MKYGCIGERLGHSFSAEIHGLIADYEYRLREVSREELGDFATAKDFKGINVTIPYKELIMPYLDGGIDDFARSVGAVNTVVNRDGRLYGYNTDFYGMCRLFEHAGVVAEGRKCVILGTGGTAKTAYAVLKALGAREIILVSRQAKGSSVTYEGLCKEHTDTEIIVNTTPVGMYPAIDGCPVDITYFKQLKGVIDAVYNPLRTALVLKAQARGIPAEGGLFMLVAQAVRASELFLGVEYPEGLTESVYEKILKDKENIVLIGMPSCGKTTVGGVLAKRLDKELFDTDRLITEKSGIEISDIIKGDGIDRFRDIEAQTIAEISAKTNAVIATGGGAILRYENVFNLKKNGKIYFIDRPPQLLTATADRPLSCTPEALMQRYGERYPLYCRYADVTVSSVGTVNETAEQIYRDFKPER